MATLQKIFAIGDDVSCLVMGLEPDYSNISLSIAELEPEDGDILNNKQRVWDQAGEGGPQPPPTHELRCAAIYWG